MDFLPETLSLWSDGNPFENDVEVASMLDVQIQGDSAQKRKTIQIKRRNFQIDYTFDTDSYRLVAVRREFSYGARPFVITETVTDFRPEVQPSDVAFTPPADAKQVELPESPPGYHPSLKRGADPLPIEATDMEGKAFRLDDYRGKVVLLNFWATWCGPCLAKFPFMNELEAKFKARGFAVVGVSCDDDLEKAKSALKQRNVTWRNILHTQTKDGVPVRKRYEVGGLPFLILIGRDGKILDVNPNPGRSLEKRLETILAESGPLSND